MLKVQLYAIGLLLAAAVVCPAQNGFAYVANSGSDDVSGDSFAYATSFQVK